MILMTSSSWQEVHRSDLGSVLGGAGYTDSYPPPQYEGKGSPSHGNYHFQIYKIHELGVVSSNFTSTCEKSIWFQRSVFHL